MPLQLLSHQRETIAHAASANAQGHGTLLFHEMGTGKTITALSLCMQLFPDRDVVVYAPPHLKSTWEAERKLVDPRRTLSLRVASFDALAGAKNLKNLKTSRGIVIVDEAHYLLDLIRKSPRVFDYLRSFHRAYFLSGTPFRTSVDEIAVYVNILARKNVVPGTIDAFKKQYTVPLTRTQKIWNNWFVRSIDELMKMTQVYQFIKAYFFPQQGYSYNFERMEKFVASYKNGKELDPAFYAFAAKEGLRQNPAIRAKIKSMMIWIFRVFWADRLLYRSKLNEGKLAKYVGRFVTVVTSDQVRSHDVTFPKVTRTREIFSYTNEQRAKLFSMLSKEDGIIKNSNLRNLYGNELTSNVNMYFAVPKLSVNRTAIGTDIGRVSGWSAKSTPQKFKHIANLCKRRRRIVLYSRFKHVAANLVKHLEHEGFGSRVQNKLDSYPSFNMTSTQRAFEGQKDILVLHPKMTEGISVKNASTLVILEPFSDAATKQQLEARVVRLGSGDAVEIVTCITGIDLFYNPFAKVGTATTVIKMLFSGFKSKIVAMIKSKKLSEVPPWLAIRGVQHLDVGPEVSQEFKMYYFEEEVFGFRRTLQAMIQKKKNSKPASTRK